MIPLWRALTFIGLSALILCGSAYLILRSQGYFGSSDRETPITVIVQTGPVKEALPSAYLAQLMGLSRDHPTKMKEFDPALAEKGLLSSPVIREAKVKLIRSGVVYVDYSVRQPVASLVDFENTAIDAEGVPIPLSPFYPPKNLPAIYLGESSIAWNQPIKNKQLQQAFTLLKLLRSLPLNDMQVRTIDVSHSQEKSLGRREIILFLEDKITKEGADFIFPRFLRLSSKHVEQELGNYLTLREKLIKVEKEGCPVAKNGQTVLYCPSKVFDLRLSNIGFIASPAQNSPAH